MYNSPRGYVVPADLEKQKGRSFLLHVATCSRLTAYSLRRRGWRLVERSVLRAPPVPLTPTASSLKPLPKRQATSHSPLAAGAWRPAAQQKEPSRHCGETALFTDRA